MTRHGIDLDTPAIREFCRKWKITELSVFGSITRDDFRPDSDIDFLVEWEPHAGWDLCDRMDMIDELSEIVGRKVDLVGKKAIRESENRFRRRSRIAALPLRASGFSATRSTASCEPLVQRKIVLMG